MQWRVLRTFVTAALFMTVALPAAAPSPAAGAGDSAHPAPLGFFESDPLCATETAPPDAPEPTEPTDVSTVAIGSFNVLFASGSSNASLDARIPLIVDAIAQSGADVVGIQEDELIGSRGVTSERIARALGAVTGDDWSWCFFAANPIIPGTPDTYVGGGNPQSDPLMPLSNTLGEQVWRTGVGLVSRHPIADAGAHRLPRRVAAEVGACGDDAVCQATAQIESRVALRALVDAPGGPVNVVSTHLVHTISSESSASRLAQANDLRSWIDAFSHGSATPTVVTGDFNAQSETPVHDVMIDAGFADTFRVAEPTDPGLTSGQNVTAPTSTVRSRIDYVFARAGACASPLSDGSGVVASEVIGDSPAAVDAGFLWPSDHYGVVSTLRPFPYEAAACPVTFTARFGPPFSTGLTRLASAAGVSIESLVRAGVGAFRSLADDGAAVPVAVPPANDGDLVVTVSWPAEEVAAIEAAAAAWGVDADQLHELGGILLIVVILHLSAHPIPV